MIQYLVGLIEKNIADINRIISGPMSTLHRAEMGILDNLEQFRSDAASFLVRRRRAERAEQELLTTLAKDANAVNSVTVQAELEHQRRLQDHYRDRMEECSRMIEMLDERLRVVRDTVRFLGESIDGQSQSHSGRGASRNEGGDLVTRIRQIQQDIFASPLRQGRRAARRFGS